ncbi:polyphosphate kinase 1 [Adlercreutzia sp. ZJ154]|uniref:polyphosphate kinase 1 n=1 Tax=Adlercreutzia sp. ZJ154 TaxID=2709790 RepID=UPI0013ECEDE2|nr:polyphosphate kinase 1 [Adlercreutzia sp. ZJ154]
MSEDGKSLYVTAPYLQNRELSWLEFNKRVLDQGIDDTVPLLERLSFISIFWSNLQEFFMVRVGSLTDLSLLKKTIIDQKSGMTPAEQLSAIYKRCHELYPYYEDCFNKLQQLLLQEGILNVENHEIDEEQRAFLDEHFQNNIMPFLSPQIINAHHPFPHLENGALYVVVRLDEHGSKKKSKTEKGGAEGVTLGIIPLPRQCERIVKLPGAGCQFMLLESIIEMNAAAIFNMYKVKHTNVICVTRNADLDAAEGSEEQGEDYREQMKRILKRRARLAPVRLESHRELSTTVKRELLERLQLKSYQTFVSAVPLDMSYVYDLRKYIDSQKLSQLTYEPFTPAWPACLDRKRSVINQIVERDILVSYPYESMDSLDMLLREAAVDPAVVSIKITLYRLAKQSRMAEALIAAAEAGKEVTAVFELRARFDESNNIEWSQRFEQAGCKVLYGFRELKVHSKICCITRQTPDGLQHITQLGTGNYNEKTAALYTDFSFMTADPQIGEDATMFFRNLALECLSDEYKTLWVAPLMIKQHILDGIDEQIERHKQGLPSGLFFKTNSITDLEVIEKIVEASQAGVKCTLLVRGISCIVPGLADYTGNVCVVSIVGRLLEHSRIYCFGPLDADARIYMSSADLMTRNMDKRVEIAWPITNERLRQEVIGYIGTCMADTAKLRDLLPNKEYTPLRFFAPEDPQTGMPVLFDAQAFLIGEAQKMNLAAAELDAFARASSIADSPCMTARQHQSKKKKKLKPEDLPAIETTAPIVPNLQDAPVSSAQTKTIPVSPKEQEQEQKQEQAFGYGMKSPNKQANSTQAATTMPIDAELLQKLVDNTPRPEPVAKAVARHAKAAHDKDKVLYNSPETFFEKPQEDNQIVIPAEKTGFFSRLFGK